MGSIKLREALKCLCDEIGWSYAVFWRSVGSESSMHFVWEDGHVVEDRMEVLVHKIMAQQVHLVGEGIVGQAAATGSHKWIVTDNIHVNASGPKDLAELNHQFLAGIQTITVIPLLLCGVLQLGSTQRVTENIRFVNHVKNLFEQLECVTGALLPDMAQKALGQTSQLLNGIPVVVSEMLPDQLTLTTASVPNPDAFRKIIYPVCQQNILVNSQSETRCLRDHRVICNPDMRSIQPVLPDDSALKYEYQHSPFTSGLCSSSLSLPEQQLARFTNTWESTNRIGPESDNMKAFSPSFREPIFLDSIKHSEIHSFSRRIDTCDSANVLGSVRSLSDGTRETRSSPYPNASPTDVAQMLSSSHFKSNQGILIDPSPSYLSFNTSQRVASEICQKQEDGLCTTYDIPSTESDIHSLCNQALLSTLQECRLSSSNAFQEDQSYDIISDAFGTNISQAKPNIKDNDESKFSHVLPLQSTSGNDLYDMLGLGYKTNRFGSKFGDVLVNKNDTSTNELQADNSTCLVQLDVCPLSHSLNDSVSGVGTFSTANANQLLDAMVSKINSDAKECSDSDAYQKANANTCSSSARVSSPSNKLVDSLDQMQGKSLSLPLLGKAEVLGSCSANSACSFDNITENCYQNDGIYKSHISLWVENGQTMQNDNLSGSQSRKIEEKPNRKRARPGENPRPRPKDRQMIMDRVKELREIIPNGTKCSIDALLEKTIKHMLFLQSVTKHADDLKDIGDPKFITKEGGVLLKDKFEGGAAWAFQIGSQSMTCPIVVEDLNPPRQMIVEMLCERRGFFLEIADLIRRLGLTILKGAMEAHKDKIWARFAVEADRDVTRMEIFLSIVHMLESTVGCGAVPQGVDSINVQHNVYNQSCIAATGASTRLL